MELEPMFHAPIYGYDLRDRESGYDFVLVDRRGRTLRREPIRVQGEQPHGDAGRLPSRVRIAQTIVLDPDAAALVVQRDGAVLHRVERVPDGPTIVNLELTRDDEQWVLGWETQHHGDADLLHGIAVTYDGGERWQRMSRPSSTARFIVDPADLAGGDECRFRAFTSDGFNTSHADTESFAMATKPPLVVPLEPEDGSILAAGQLARLEAEAICPRSGSLEGDSIRWSSDIQGRLGTGRELWVELTEGEHVISVTAGGARDSSATAQISLRVLSSSRE